MLAVSTLGNNHDHHLQYHFHDQEENMESFSGDGFHDFCNGNSLLDSIDFDDLFIGIHEGDVLPNLEMDPELLAEFSVAGNTESGTLNSSSGDDRKLCARDDDSDYSRNKVPGLSASDNESDRSLNSRGDEVVSKMDGDELTVVTPAREEASNVSKGKKWKVGQCKNNDNAQGKRKVKKVDWTPELHRKFVQAVEQLGVDKAVPSRILELMGIDCLTRHNIASHLQKYRSHRKHLLAREAEAASWSQRRQMYGAVPVVAAPVASGGGSKARDVISPWLAPVVPTTLGCFPPVTPTPMPHFRPLHVWGHPTSDQSRVNMWQKHHPPPPSTPPPAWPPAVQPHHHLPPENLYWPLHHQRVANVASAGTVPCFAPPLIAPPTRFGAPLVPGLPPHPMYKVKPIITNSFGPAHHPLDLHPSKESIDAAIGDVLSKPWLPMPLGLKPPSVDGVMGELHRQGVPSIPPNSCA